ncbi:Ig-like domain-containing protein [Conexibacter sp. SYSU D00693]|uniref:Ig-like domain-containing protein n=1 Tax=Conexibacter sp. SYSU D00693 TaxID=2812560 RepID=UPI00196A9A25|nr:cadherin-like domain-containing protein [Conexibacter sp. SYSU D00693]
MPRRLPSFATLAAALTALACAAPQAASAASVACSTADLSVTSLQSADFYVDEGEDYVGSYVGYAIKNDGAGTTDDLWVRLENFTGGVVKPASGAATTAPRPLDDLTAGATTPAYAYLKALTPTTTPQGHDVVVYDGRPGAGGVEVCREAKTFNRVVHVIAANPNRVTGVTVTPATVSLGGTFEVKIAGETGEIGAGPDGQGLFRYSPAVDGDWPSSAFRLVDVKHQLPTGSLSPRMDWLSQSGLASLSSTYTTTYTFRVVGPTSGATTVVPVSYIASGGQIKHTGAFPNSIPPIPKVTSSAQVTVASVGQGPYTSGDPVTLTATVTNTGGGPIDLDELTMQLPTGWSPVPGSAERDGTPLPDPFADSAGLHLTGPHTVPANGSSTFEVTATAGAPGTSGQFTAVGTLAGGQVDGTLDPEDDTPASTTLMVLGNGPAPVATADSDLATSGVAKDVDVLANDADVAGGVLTIASGPSHGTASVVAGKVRYTPAANYVGSDQLTYQVLTPNGTATAVLTVTVAAPLPPAPAPANKTSEDTAPAVQQVTITVPAGGSAALIGPGGPTTTVTVANVGRYDLDVAAGTITFTPAPGYAATAPALTYRVTDALNRSGDATYVAKVNPPAPPAVSSKTSTGVGPAVQTQTLTAPAGTTLTLLDQQGSPSTLVTVPGEGTYALDVTTGQVNFVPAVGFKGQAGGVTFRVTDAYGQARTATYKPTVVLPPAPKTEDKTTSAGVDQRQQTKLEVPAGSHVRLLQGDTEVTELTVDGEGTYTLDPDTAVVTFVPAPGFRGAPRGVTFRVVDVYGQSVTATYQPQTVATAEPPATATPPAATPATAKKPARRPKASVALADLTVARGPLDRQVPAVCRVTGARMVRCTVTVTADVAGRRVVVGRGVRTVSAAVVHRKVRVRATLSSLGRALTRQVGGARLQVVAKVATAGAGEVATRRDARVVAHTVALVRPVLFDTDSARLRAGEVRYLRGLRGRLGGVRALRCTGSTDSRSTGEHNVALGRARAQAVCRFLNRGTGRRATAVTRGEVRPVATNSTAEGMQRNRRTVIRLTY